MDILLWLVPTGVVALAMMVWATWAGRPRREEADRSEVAYERFAQAMTRKHPGLGRPRPMVVRDRSTGIAVRPSRGAGASRPPVDRTRRSA